MDVRLNTIEIQSPSTNNLIGTPLNATQTLKQCLEKFKRVLPEEKYTRLEILVKQLQFREITREEFDKKYFEIMLPYVTPPALPAKYANVQTIYIPPYRLSQEAKKQFIQYFQVSREEKYDLLKDNPELVQILRQFVILQRQQQIPLQDGSVQVVQIDGEKNLIEDRKNEEQDSNPAKKRKIASSSGITPEELSALEKLREELEEYKKKLDETQKKNEELQSMITVYKDANIDVLEKFNYEQLTEISDTLCANLSSVTKILKRKHEEEQNDKYGLNCLICYENRKNVIFRPCSHVVQCDHCPIPKECPVCKKKIEMAGKIYL